MLSTIQNSLTPELVSRLSAYFGASSEQTKTGLTAIIPAVLAGIAQKGSTEAGAQKLIAVMKDTGLGGIVDAELAGDGQATAVSRNITHTLFGDNLSGLTQTLSRVTNLPDNLVARMINFAAPFVLGFVGREAAAKGYDPSWLASFLASQKTAILTALPAGLGAVLGLGSAGIGGMPEAVVTATRSTHTRSGSGWSAVAAIAVLLIGGLWLWQRNRPQNFGTAPISSAPATPPPALSDLNDALSTPQVGDQPKALSFEEITFDSGKSTLTPAGRTVVDELAGTLKMHPLAVIRIVGHTDGVGDGTHNKQLSLDRAETVRALLISRGVEPSHLDVAGKGDEEPVASNATDAGRAKNRRIDVVVLSTTGETGVAH